MQRDGVLALDLEKFLMLKTNRRSKADIILCWSMTKLPAGESSLHQWSEMTVLALPLPCAVRATVGTFLLALGLGFLTCK